MVQPALPDAHVTERENLQSCAKLLYEIWLDGREEAVGDRRRSQGHDNFQGWEVLETELDEYEAKQAKAYSEYLAKVAADDPQVRTFRHERLGGRLLTEDQAQRYLSDHSPFVWSDVSCRLAETYPWTENQAAWFLLTGKPQEIQPLAGRSIESKAGSHIQGFILIKAQPWVSPETARNAYLRLQKRTLGRSKRRVGDRNLALFRFVIEQVERVHVLTPVERDERAKQVGQRSQTITEVVGPTWQQLMDRWNERYPEGHGWRYENVRNFSRDFRNAERLIAHLDR